MSGLPAPVGQGLAGLLAGWLLEARAGLWHAHSWLAAVGQGWPAACTQQGAHLRALLALCRTDAEWHHVAVTWSYESGEVKLFFDGQEKRPFWVSSAGSVEVGSSGSGAIWSSHDIHIWQCPALGSVC